MVWINYAGTQVTQCGFQNKRMSGWTGTSSFVLVVPPSHHNLLCTTWQDRATNLVKVLGTRLSCNMQRTYSDARLISPHSLNYLSSIQVRTRKWNFQSCSHFEQYHNRSLVHWNNCCKDEMWITYWQFYRCWEWHNKRIVISAKRYSCLIFVLPSDPPGIVGWMKRKDNLIMHGVHRCCIIWPVNDKISS